MVQKSLGTHERLSSFWKSNSHNCFAIAQNKLHDYTFSELAALLEVEDTYGESNYSIAANDVFKSRISGSIINTQFPIVFFQNSKIRMVSGIFFVPIFFFPHLLFEYEVDSEWHVFNQFTMLPISSLKKDSKNSAGAAMLLLPIACRSLVVKTYAFKYSKLIE